MPFEEFDIFYRTTFKEVDHKTEDEYVSDDLESLLHEAFKERGLRWRLQCLNKSLGSLRKGDFGFIFARPETGKTTFLVSEITNFLMQTKDPVLWFNNEEQGNKVMIRLYQAFFGCTIQELILNPKKYKQAFDDDTEGRLKIVDRAHIHYREAEKHIVKLNPALVIYDQLPKIVGFTADRKDLQLGAIFRWARELAKSSHAAIGVSQADGTAEGVRYLTMEHVADAKTAVQAEADWILGIGKTHDTNNEFTRYLNISKNKLFGDDDSDPMLKHGRFETIIEPQRARYVDVMSYD